MRIALAIDGRLPADRYGGSERVVAWLARALLRAGHEVTVLARPGSYVPGARMIPVRDGRDAPRNVPRDIDIAHFHSTFPSPDYRLPNLSTIHGNHEGALRPADNLCFVSADHARRHGRATFVHNGLPPDEHLFRQAKSERYLFLARINRPGKNVTQAIELARTFDLQLDLAGGGRWELLTRSRVRRERAFFRSFQRRFRFHGMVGGWRKAELLANARALLFPIRWEEPFGLVVIEALLAGTPVVAAPRGAMPELIQPDVGFLCSSDADYAAAFEGVGALSANRCRDYARERFSAEEMARRYLDLYRRVLDGEPLP